MKKLFVILGIFSQDLLAQPAVLVAKYIFDGDVSTPFYVNPLVLSSAGNMYAGAGLTAVGYTNGQFALPDRSKWAQNWSNATQNLNDHFGALLTPIAGGYTLVIDSVRWKARRSSTGPDTMEFRMSTNAFAPFWKRKTGPTDAWRNFSVTSGFTPGLPGGSVDLRVYGRNVVGTLGAGSFRIDNFEVYAHLDTVYNLPVELTHFTAKPENSVVKLDWSTATETNNNYFTVYRSNDLETWEEVTRVTGAGNSQSSISYETVDDNPFVGISYYKLQQTDFDGQSKDVGIVSVQMKESKSFTFLLYQEFSWEGQTTAIFDTSGRMISGWNTVHTLTSPGIFLLVTRQGETARIHITP